MEDCALFTDVSLNSGFKLGVGAYLAVPIAILGVSPGSSEISELSGQLVMKIFQGTSSTALEVQTVLWALEDYRNGLRDSKAGRTRIYSDSQCIEGLLRRRRELEAHGFLGKRTGHEIKNADLYRRFYELHDTLGFEIIKAAGHTRSITHDTVHRIFSEVDRKVRKTLRLMMREGKVGQKGKYSDR